MMGFGKSSGHAYGSRGIYKTSESIQKDAAKRVTIDEIVNLMLSNFDILKTVLDQSAENYLRKIQNEFFRRGGKKKAENLQKRLTESKNNCDLIAAFKETIIGDYSDNFDSLGSYLYKGIYNAFCLNKSVHLDASFNSALRGIFLCDIIYNAEEKLKTEYIANATNLPADISNIVRSYS